MSHDHSGLLASDPCAPELPPDNLPEDDGEPLETPWHRTAMNVLIQSLEWHWRDRSDFYAGGNMFVYFSADPSYYKRFRGPDFFVVKDVDRFKVRRKWEAWNENGRLPDVIIELLSPTTEHDDRHEKKRTYERIFHTAEYYCYDPDHNELEGWRLSGDQRYRPIKPDPRGRLWCKQLDLWLGIWHGTYVRDEADWPRFFTASGELVLTPNEAEAQRAEAEARRADAAEAEVERLRRELDSLRAQLPKS